MKKIIIAAVVVALVAAGVIYYKKKQADAKPNWPDEDKAGKIYLRGGGGDSLRS